MSSLEIDGCGNTPGAVQSWTVMVPVAVDPSDPLYLPAIFDADPGRYLGSSNTPQHAYTEEESCSPGWLGLVYEDDHSDAALNNRWLRGLSGKGSAEGCGPYVNSTQHGSLERRWILQGGITTGSTGSESGHVVPAMRYAS